MSLLFSEITFHWEDGTNMVLYESGHPDEDDVQWLLKSERRYAVIRHVGLDDLSVKVQYCRFLGGSSRDCLAEQEHIALIKAYNEMTPDKPFTQRNDVEQLENYEFSI